MNPFVASSLIASSLTIPVSDFIWVLIGVATVGALACWMILDEVYHLDPMRMADRETVTATCGCGRLSLPGVSVCGAARIADALSRQCPNCTGPRDTQPAFKEERHDSSAVPAV